MESVIVLNEMVLVPVIETRVSSTSRSIGTSTGIGTGTGTGTGTEFYLSTLSSFSLALVSELPISDAA